MTHDLGAGPEWLKAGSEGNGRSLAKRPDGQRFFIAGCQRSGTTLMRLVLECHPEIFCFDETQSYQCLSSGIGIVPPGKRLIGYKIPRWTEQLAEPQAGDFRQAEQATAFYQSEPVIFLIRDVRDTAVSMMRLNAGQGSWLEVFGRGILDAKIGRPAFAKRFAREICQLRAYKASPPAIAALYWKYKTQSYFDYRARGWPICGVSYEALVSHPEQQLRRIVAKLGLQWHPGLLDHPAFPHTEVAECGFTVGHTDPRRAIDSESVGRWRQVLSPAELAQIEAIAGDLTQRLAAEGVVHYAAAWRP